MAAMDLAPIDTHIYQCACPCCGTSSLIESETATGTGNATKPVFTDAQVTTALTKNWSSSGYDVAWNESDVSYTISFLGAASGGSEASGWEAMTPGKLAAARTSFELWDDVIDIDLNETPNNASADIAFNYSSSTGGSTYAAWSGSYGGTRADRAFNDANIWLADNWWSHDQDSDLYQGGYGITTYLHEIGHALGLSHPGAYNGSAGYASNASHHQDTRQYTVMSYFNVEANNSDTDHIGSNGYTRAYAATPLLNDILALQSLYGADMTTRTGSTTYGFNSNAGRDAFDFTKNTNPVVAIWDAGGNDTLDASGFNTNQMLDLTSGNFSSIGHLTYNVAIAHGATIENAVGGGGNDTIIGNASANRLQGGGGNDAITGGGGADTFYFGSSDSGAVISDFATEDRLQFATTGLAATVFNSLGSSGSNSVLTINGSQIRLTNVDEQTLSLSGNSIVSGTAPTPTPDPTPTPTPSPTNDVYAYAKTDGVLTISGAQESATSGSDDKVVFSDLTMADVEFLRAGDSLRVAWSDGSASGSVIVAQGGSHIESFEFADGSTISRVNADFAAHRATNPIAGDKRDIFFGSAEGEQINGTAGSDTIYGFAGDDILDAGATADGWQYLYGGGGNDTYQYGKESGQVFIHTETASSGTNDRLILKDLDLADVTFSTFDYGNAAYGEALRIEWNDGTDSGEVRLTQMGSHIESFEFADGSVVSGINADYAARRASNPIEGDEHDVFYGSAEDDQIIGTAGSDTIYGFDGDDVLDAGANAAGWQYLYGGGGNDTYQYGKESGQVFIHTETASSGTNDRLILKDLELADVTFSTLDYGNAAYGEALRIEWNDGTDSGEVRLTQMGSHIESFEFADGSVVSGINADYAARRASNPVEGDERDVLYGSADGDVIIGTGGSDTIYGFGGNDVLDAGATAGGWQYLYGGGGNDTYKYGKESGQVFVNSETSTSGTNDRLIFDDLDFADVSFSTFDYGNAVHGEALRIQWNDGANSGEVRLAHMGSNIERFEFADGSVHTYDDFF